VVVNTVNSSSSVYAHLNQRVQELDEKISQEAKKYSWDKLGDEIHEVNVDKGFWKEPEMMDKYAAKMMLVVTETAEVIEALRKSQGSDKVTEEFADIFIRALDLYKVLVDAGEADPALYEVLLDKVETNKSRPPKHGNRWG
jgi:NTP pyrophosphatase (non-canonical NTP hydrolase)